MKRPERFIRAVFLGISQVARRQRIEFAGLRVQGVPALLLGSAAVVLAAGVCSLLARAGERLPETLSEARGLIEATRSPRSRLNP